jgi:hypothetical protein
VMLQRAILLKLLSVFLFRGEVVAQDSGVEKIDGPFVLRYGVVVDVERDEIFAMAPEGGVNAISLSDGKLTWNRTDVWVPLIVSSGVLVCQAKQSSPHGLAIKLLDPSNGNELASTEIGLPNKVVPYVGTGSTGRFEVEAFAFENESALVKWSFFPIVRRGVTDLNEPAPQLMEDAAIVKLSDGAVRKADVSDVERLKLRNSSMAVVNRINTKSPFVQGFSSDGRHTLEGKKHGGDKGIFYNWRLVERDSGKVIGEFRSEVAAFAPFVSKLGRLYFVDRPALKRSADGRIENKPPSIRVIELSNSKELWSHEIRDTSFRGPSPP